MNRRMRSYKGIFILIGLIGVVVVLYKLGIANYFSLDALKQHAQRLKEFVQVHYIESALIFIGIYSAGVGVSLPIVGPLALIGGYLFGVLWGMIYALIGATIGAVLAFLVLRHLVGPAWRQHYQLKFARFAKRVKEDGAWYLLMLHFLSVFPFFVINMLAVLGNISVFTVLWTSAIGSLPFILVYTWAGSELRSITSFRDIWSYKVVVILGVLALLSIVPLVIKRIWQVHKK